MGRGETGGANGEGTVDGGRWTVGSGRSGSGTSCLFAWLPPWQTIGLGDAPGNETSVRYLVCEVNVEATGEMRWFRSSEAPEYWRLAALTTGTGPTNGRARFCKGTECPVPGWDWRLGGIVDLGSNVDIPLGD